MTIKEPVINQKKFGLGLQKSTQLIFIASKLLSSPLEAMYVLLVFICCKDLQATPLQITLIVSAKPAVALLSFYGNLFIKGKPDRLKSFIICTNLLGILPSFFFPFVNSVWFYLFSYALFMMSTRAIIPAWAEIFKINLSPEQRGKVFSRGSSANYIIHIFVPLLLSPLLDQNPLIWKWIYFTLAIGHGLTIFLSLCLRIHPSTSTDSYKPYDLASLGSILLGPWKNSWNLMKQRADFRNYQLVFMLGGSGLIIMHPALPIFFKDTLQLSYTQLTFATSLCKGLSFALTAPIWARWLNHISINLFNFYVTLFAGAFAFFVLLSQHQLALLYLGYLIYGTMQAGSELSWNLSGPIFAKEKDSTLFTGVNIVMVGFRGCIVPFIGELLLLQINSSFVFICGGLLCLMGSCYSIWLDFKAKTPQEKLIQT